MSKVGVKTPTILGLVAGMKRELLYFDQLYLDTYMLEKDLQHDRCPPKNELVKG